MNLKKLMFLLIFGLIAHASVSALIEAITKFKKEAIARTTTENSAIETTAIDATIIIPDSTSTTEKSALPKTNKSTISLSFTFTSATSASFLPTIATKTTALLKPTNATKTTVSPPKITASPSTTASSVKPINETKLSAKYIATNIIKTTATPATIPVKTAEKASAAIASLLPPTTTLKQTKIPLTAFISKTTPAPPSSAVTSSLKPSTLALLNLVTSTKIHPMSPLTTNKQTTSTVEPFLPATILVPPRTKTTKTAKITALPLTTATLVFSTATEIKSPTSPANLSKAIKTTSILIPPPTTTTTTMIKTIENITKIYIPTLSPLSASLPVTSAGTIPATFPVTFSVKSSSTSPLTLLVTTPVTTLVPPPATPLPTPPGTTAATTSATSPTTSPAIPLATTAATTSETSPAITIEPDLLLTTVTIEKTTIGNTIPPTPSPTHPPTQLSDTTVASEIPITTAIINKTTTTTKTKFIFKQNALTTRSKPFKPSTTSKLRPTTTPKKPLALFLKRTTRTYDIIRRVLPTLVQQCGQRPMVHNFKNRKLAGGLRARKNAWPWIALLHYNDGNDGGVLTISFKCGGTLITARHVLTAAHCIREDLDLVRLGEYDLSTETEAKTVDIPIVNAISHPDYNKLTGRSDVAVLYLQENAPINDLIRPICLPYTDSLLRKSYAYSKPFVAGWGHTLEGSSTSNVLEVLGVRILENSVCREVYKKFKRLFSDDQFDNAVLCGNELAGDSGGPLMVTEVYQNKPRFFLIGIVSNSVGFARKDVPGVYTSTQYFLPWIKQQVSDRVSPKNF